MREILVKHGSPDESWVTCPFRNSEWGECKIQNATPCAEQVDDGDFEYHYKLPENCPLHIEDIIVKLQR